MRARSPHGARTTAVFAAALAVSCSQGQNTSTSTSPLTRAHGGTIVARFADETITAEELQAFARRERCATVREALDRYVSTRLLAREAARRGELSNPAVIDTARRAAVQALLFERVERSISEQQIPRAALDHAQRTVGFRRTHGPLQHVVHALVAPPTGAVAIDDREARRARAESIRSALAAAPRPLTIDAVRASAERTIGAGQLRVESVTGFDHTGATATPTTIDRAFAQAAADLRAIGDVSPVIETPFGFHVIVLERREDAAPTMDPAEVEREVKSEALTLARARATQALLTELRARHRVQFMNNGESEP